MNEIFREPRTRPIYWLFRNIFREKIDLRIRLKRSDTLEKCIYIYTKNIVYTFIWLGVLFIWEPSHFMPLFLLNPPSPIYKIY